MAIILNIVNVYIKNYIQYMYNATELALDQKVQYTE